ncbi:hypothetical protein [Nostoc sp. ChiSLP03a]|uniref:hypothetical protein n=1 Tax=Nostoc sp. ChiSLP03a TaxID=3075380 RepID=UPI002AD749DE|nr:hypothetical protein [Nostoc sp. ChiSLP03a]
MAQERVTFLLFQSLITQVAGYQAVGTLHLNSRALVQDEVAVARRATATSINSKIQILN